LLYDKGAVVGETTTDAEGKFTFPMEPSKNYVFYVEKEQYLTLRQPFSTVGKAPAYEELTQKETTIDLTSKLVMDKIKLQQTFVVENINYDYDKSDIRPDAALELDKIVQFLQDNPTITIELSSHTDSRGDDTYNLKLSQKRAETSKTYIVSKGVKAVRITSIGYGETKPLIADAATEEDFQKNRRTEFKVIKVAGMK
jgi:outer membrane protein OmpA-like peptidoglycan-associated protein